MREGFRPRAFYLRRSDLASFVLKKLECRGCCFSFIFIFTDTSHQHLHNKL